MKSRAGFTIIEMLVVITIISILASILLPAVSSAQKKAKIAKTQGMIDAITMAFKQYRTEYGAYPPVDIPGVTGETSAECIYYYSAATFVAGTNSNQISVGPYMEYRAKDKTSTSRLSDMDGDGASDDTLYQVIDPWANALNYTFPGTNNTSYFDINSKGPDGVNGNSDDVKNW